MGAAGATMGVQAFGGVYSAYSQAQMGAAQNDYYKYLAKVSERQAGLLRTESERAVGQTSEEASRATEQLREETNKLMGAQRVALAVNGVTGVTADDLEMQSLTKAQKDEALIRYNADLKAYEIKKQAYYKDLELKTQAEGYKMAGKNALTAGKVGAISSLLGSAASVGQTYLMYNNTSMGKTNNTGTLTKSNPSYYRGGASPSFRMTLGPSRGN